MKIIIADDEKMVRVALISMIHDISTDYEIVAEARNGEQLLDMVKNYKPDVAFVDIKMPKVDGLSAIKSSKKISPYTKWVILTGFSYFEYAKQAVKLGAVDYLLKPPNPKELEEILSKISQQRNNEISILNKKFERDIMTSYYSFCYLKNKETSNFLFNHIITGMMFIVDSILDEKTKAEKLHKLYTKLNDLASNIISRNLNIAIFNLVNGELAAACVYHDTYDKQENKKKISKYFDIANEIACELSNEKLKITIIKIEETKSIINFYNLLNRTKNYLCLRVILGLQTELCFKHLVYCSKATSKLDFCNLITKLCDSFIEKKILNYSKILKKIKENSIELCNPKVRKYVFNFIYCSIGCKLNTKKNSKNWVEVLKRYGDNIINYKNDSTSSCDMTKQVKEYVEQNYMKDVSISLIADELNVTPNYLSRLFRLKTGTKFVDFLTQVRITEAKKMLLQSPDINVKEVANNVGYYSTSHFIKVFSKLVGCYPSKYKECKKLLKKN